MQPSNSRGTILLVSSDDDLRRMIRAYLEHTGFVVISCTGSPRSADVLAQAGGLRMMVLDVGSLQSPSLQVAGEIAARSIDLPVVIIAGSNIEREEIQIIAARGWKLLKKPLRMPDLLAVVQRIFDRDAVNRSMPPLLCKIA